jgi:hypothetical protein
MDYVQNAKKQKREVKKLLKVKEENNDIINKIITNLENELDNVVKYYKVTMRDEIKQETRIRLWNLLVTVINDDPDSTYEELMDICLNHIYFISVYCSKLIKVKQYYNYHKNLVPLYDDIDVSSEISNSDKHLSAQIDLLKYKNILTRKEFTILQYLYEVDCEFNNFDEICRQLGYTGKGAFKYIALRIASKINNFNKKVD